MPAKLVPVDFDPFAQPESGSAKLVEVDFDPFAQASPAAPPGIPAVDAFLAANQPQAPDILRQPGTRGLAPLVELMDVVDPATGQVSHYPMADSLNDAIALNERIDREIARQEGQQAMAQYRAALETPSWVDSVLHQIGNLSGTVGTTLEGAGEGVSHVWDAVAGDPATAIASLFGSDADFTMPNPLSETARMYRMYGDWLDRGTGAGYQQLLADNALEGDITDPSSWSLGKNPSVRGFAERGMEVLGSLAPVLAATYLSGGSAAAGAITGGAQGGGAAVEQARQTIDQLYQEGKLAQESTVYRDLLAAGVPEAEALARTRDEAEEWAFTLTTPVSALGGALTSRILAPGSQLLARSSLPTRVLGTTTASAAEESAQEYGEGVATQAGINTGAGTNLDVNEGSFANTVLGALGGAGPGAVAGLTSRGDPVAPEIRRAYAIAIDDNAPVADRMAALMQLDEAGFRVPENEIKPADPNAEPLEDSQQPRGADAMAALFSGQTPTQMTLEQAPPRRGIDEIVVPSRTQTRDLGEFDVTPPRAAPQADVAITVEGRPVAQPAVPRAEAPQAAPDAADASNELDARVAALEPRVRALDDDTARAVLDAMGPSPQSPYTRAGLGRDRADPRDLIMAEHPDDIEAGLAAIEGGQPNAEAVHADPGQTPEPATPAVVDDALEEAAENTPRNLGEARQFLLDKIDAAIAAAPKAAELPHPGGSNRADREKARREQLAGLGYVTFDVPGDGKFRVINSDETLAEFRDKVAKSQGFREKVPPKRGPRLPPLTASAAERERIMAEAEVVDEQGDAPAQQQGEWREGDWIETPYGPRQVIATMGKYLSYRVNPERAARGEDRSTGTLAADEAVRVAAPAAAVPEDEAPAQVDDDDDFSHYQGMGSRKELRDFGQATDEMRESLITEEDGGTGEIGRWLRGYVEARTDAEIHDMLLERVLAGESTTVNGEPGKYTGLVMHGPRFQVKVGNKKVFVDYDHAANDYAIYAGIQDENVAGRERPTGDKTLRAEDLDTKPPEEVFPPPAGDKTVYAKDLAGGELLTKAEADARVAEWKNAAKRVGETQDNSNKVIFSLFDKTGNWSKPWRDAGYTVYQYDIQDGDDLIAFMPMADILAAIEDGKQIYGVLAAPPCTSFAVSGARWWADQHDNVSPEMVAKKYGDWASLYFDTPLEYAKTLVATTEAIIEFANPSNFHVLENPIGRIRQQTGLPRPLLTFDPSNFGNPYTKRTQLWGDFNPNLPTANVEPTEGSKMQNKLRGDNPEDKIARSTTPDEFAYAFFMANHENGVLMQEADASGDGEATDEGEGPPARRSTVVKPGNVNSRTVAVSATFWADHAARAPYVDGEEGPKPVGRRGKTVLFSADDPGLRLLLSDAEYYADPSTMDEVDDSLRAAAARVVAKLKPLLSVDGIEQSRAAAVVDDDIAELDAELDAISEGDEDFYDPDIDETTDGEIEREEVRRIRKRKSKKKAGPISNTRENAPLAYELDIFMDNGYVEDDIANMPPKQKLAVARRIVQDTFGFKVEIAPNINTLEALNQLTFAYRNLQAMAAVMSWPAQVFGKINPTLKLVRTAGGALAYYAPGTQEIAVTRQNDAYAHEFGHAIDFWTWQAMGLIDPATGAPKGRGATGKLKLGASLKQPGVEGAYGRVLEALFKSSGDAAFKVSQIEKHILIIQRQIADLQGKLATAIEDDRIARIKDAIAKREAHKVRLAKQIANIQANPKPNYIGDSDYYLNARMIDKREGAPDPVDGGYWQRPTEMFARAFEAYVANRLEAVGASTEFLGRTDAGYLQDSSEFIAKAYPQALEREAIFDAIDDLIIALRDDMIGGVPGPIITEINTANPLAPLAWRQWVPHEVKPLDVKNAIRDVMDEARGQRNDHAKADAQAGQLRRRVREARGASEDRLYYSTLLRVHDTQVDVRRGWGATIGGWLQSMEMRYPESDGFKTLNRIFVTTPGSGRLKSQTYEEYLQSERNKWADSLGRIIDKHKLNSSREWSEDEHRQLRDALVDWREAAERPDYPAKILAAAQDLRVFHDELFMYLQNNGVDVGYARNGYLQRIMNPEQVMLDQRGFLDAAGQVYAEVFERDVGTGDSIDMGQFLRYAVELLGQDTPTVKQLRRLLAKRGELQAQGKDLDAVDDAIDDLLHGEDGLYSAVQDAFASEAAQDWMARLLGTVANDDFSVQTAQGRFMKSRVLPESADILMGDFMVTDARSLAATYMTSAINRVAFEKFIPGDGAAAGRIDALRAQLARDGVLPADAEEAVEAIKVMVGLYRPNLTKAGIKFSSSVVSTYAPVLLGRSLFSQLVEPFVAMQRTNNVLDGLSIYKSQLRDLGQWLPGVAQTINALTGGNPKRKAEMARELASFVGAVSHAQFDHVMNNRENTMYANKRAGQKIAAFYRFSAIHGHTMSMRRAAVERSTYYLKRIAKKALKGNKLAVADLADLGIDFKDQELVKYLAEDMPLMPSVSELQASGHAQKLSVAINRFVDEIIMNPKIVDKPRKASTAEWAYIYGVLSYTSAFTHNVIFRTFGRVGTAWRVGGPTEAAKAGALASLMFGINMTAQTAQYLLRVSLFGDLDDELDRWKKDPELAALTILSRSGWTGLADPIVNAFTGVRYRRSFSELLAGAYVGYPLQAANRFAVGAATDTDTTNTAEYNQVGAVYDAIAAPIIAHWILTRMPWAAPALAWVSAPSTRRAVAETLVGEKGTREKSGKTTDNRQTTRHTGRNAGRGAGREGGR